MITAPEQFRDPDLALTGNPVGFYPREMYPLDNFSAFAVRWPDQTLYPTAEHAYQAAKFRLTDLDLFTRIGQALSPHDAYVLADSNRGKIQAGWSDIKVDIMRQILKAKLRQHEYVRRKLLQTRDLPIVEDSPKDSFWGWGPDRQGRNELGKIWMELRVRLRAGEFDVIGLDEARAKIDAMPTPWQPAAM